MPTVLTLSSQPTTRPGFSTREARATTVPLCPGSRRSPGNSPLAGTPGPTRVSTGSVHTQHCIVTGSVHTQHCIVTGSVHTQHCIVTGSVHTQHCIVTGSVHTQHCIVTGSVHAQHGIVTCRKHRVCTHITRQCYGRSLRQHRVSTHTTWNCYRSLFLRIPVHTQHRIFISRSLCQHRVCTHTTWNCRTNNLPAMAQRG